MWFSLLLLSLSAADPRYAVLDLSQSRPETATSLKSAQNIEWWVELDQSMLLLVTGDIDPVPGLTFLSIKPQPERLVILRGPVPRQAAGDLLAAGGRFSVFQRDGSGKPLVLDDRLAHGHAGHSHAHTEEWPFQPNVQLAVWRRGFVGKGSCGTVQDLVDQVDEDRWYNDVAHLAGMNRNTFQPGNIQARDWLVDQFEGLGLTVSTPSFEVSGTTTFNVIATLPGTSRPDDWYVVGAHFDSTSQNTASAAPGAEDNGSGTAAVLEMARIFTAHPPEATVIFIAYSGEEQGLWGSRDHVSDLIAAGDRDKLRFALIMDMIGYTGDQDLDCLLETFEEHESFMNDLVTAANNYTSLRMVTTFNPFGSDHMPYLNEGLASVLAIENDYTQYNHYHRTTDEVIHVSREMGSAIIRMNVAALADWAGASAGIQFDEELPFWRTTVFPAGVVDVNGNLRVDVADLIAAGCP